MDETTRGNWAIVSAGVGLAFLALPFLVGQVPTVGLFLSFLVGALLLVAAALLASEEFPHEPLTRGGK
jgi:SNF family Na+-dependent transporter